MIIEQITASTIPDAWFQCVNSVLDRGERYLIEDGSFVGETRIEFDWITVYIKHPYSEPWDTMLPQIPSNLGIPNPVEDGYIERYLPYLMEDDIKDNEIYTYGSRIKQQIGYFIHRMRTKGFNSNQYILQVAKPSDAWLSDPPCLRHLDLRVKNKTLIFYPYFRSWDLWGGFPANLAAIAVLQKFMSDELEIESGPIIASSKGLHLYGYIEEAAKIRCYKEE